MAGRDRSLLPRRARQPLAGRREVRRCPNSRSQQPVARRHHHRRIPLHRHQPSRRARTVKGRRGLDGDESGLWSEFARVVREVEPTWALVENVYSGWRKWLPVVRRDLWALGYASVPLRVLASEVGAPHRRARVFVVAHRVEPGLQGHVERVLEAWQSFAGHAPRLVGVEAWDAIRPDLLPGSCVRRAGDGIPQGVGAPPIRGYGKAVVPQVAEVIGRCIMAAL
mgnify:CR=1 FL=1